MTLTGCSAAGSALDWGSRGREFKSRHSDQQKALNPNGFKAFFIFTAGMETAEKCTKSAQNVHSAEKTP